MSEEEEIIVQPPRKLSLVPDVANWHRWWSMRWLIAGAIAEALPRAWAALPGDWVGPMPTWLKLALGYFVGTALVAAAVSRVIQQTPRPAP
jgi:hypothetical protein